MSSQPVHNTGFNPALAAPLGVVRPGGEEFVGLLRKASVEESVKFSTHASQRLERRGIALGESEMGRLQTGLESLRQKSVKDGLVIVGDHRFVVSVENNTVITVMSSKDREVFTNIQGVAFE